MRLGRRVALKVLSPHLAGDAATRERIGLETMVVAALDHPNVLPLFEAEEAEGVLYLASQWIAGRDVGKLVAQKGPVAVEEAVRIVTEVASALHAAHRVGVVHRALGRRTCSSPITGTSTSATSGSPRPPPTGRAWPARSTSRRSRP